MRAPNQSDKPIITKTTAGRPRRVLFFGKSMSRTGCARGVVEALRHHGPETRWVNLNRLRRWFGQRGSEVIARRIFRQFDPDLLFVYCRDLPLPLLKEFAENTRTVIWSEQALRTPTPLYLDYFAHADLVCMTDPSYFEWLAQNGIERTEFTLEGYSETNHFPETPPRSPARDLLFIGSPGFDGRRAAFVAELANHFDLEVYGAGWDRWRRDYPRLRVHGPVKPRGYRKLCASSRIVIGLNQFNDRELYFSNRTMLTLGCQAFHLTHYVPGLETVFERGVHLDWFANVEQCIAKVKHYLLYPEERDRIAAAGYELVRREHQYKVRIGRVLDLLEQDELPQVAIPRLDRRQHGKATSTALPEAGNPAIQRAR